MFCTSNNIYSTCGALFLALLDTVPSSALFNLILNKNFFYSNCIFILICSFSPDLHTIAEQYKFLYTWYHSLYPSIHLSFNYIPLFLTISLSFYLSSSLINPFHYFLWFFFLSKRQSIALKFVCISFSKFICVKSNLRT